MRTISISYFDNICQHLSIYTLTRPGFDKVKPKYGLSTPYRLNNRNSVGLFHHVLICMGDFPTLNLSTLVGGILKMVQQVRLMMFSLNMVDNSMPFLSLLT